jgi:uncharacterized tellurite resistance protein B-like protein
MPLIFIVLLLLLAAAIVYRITERIPELPQAVGDWGFSSTNDPRVAVAALMYAVATEHHPLSPEQERHILTLLCSRIGLEPEAARACLTGGRRMASRQRGDLSTRLHRLLDPVARKCSDEEKRDVIDMLNVVAGPRAKLLGPVRDGLGRVSATLMND